MCKLRLLGTAGSWFLFDITFYGNGLFKVCYLIMLANNIFQETVIDMIGLAGGDTAYESIQNTALASMAIAAIALPGYFIAIPLTDKLGRKPIQVHKDYKPNNSVDYRFYYHHHFCLL